MARALRIAARSAIAVVLAVVPAAIVHAILRATGPLTAVGVWGGLLAVLLILASEIPERRRVFVWSALAVAAIGAFVLIADIVIIPFSAYLLWFELVPAGNARGAVSFVYVMLVAYGSVLFAASLTRRPIITLAAYTGWLSFLSLPILGRAEPLYVLFFSALVVVVAGVSHGRPLRAGLRAAAHAIVLLALAVLVGVGLGRATSPQGSRLVDDVLSPRLREVIVAVFPAFPIMYDIPGYGYRLPSENVGRPPVLSNRALFRVSGVDMETIYLRTEVFHVFTGSSWAVSSAAEAQAAREPARRAEEPGAPVFLEPEDAPDGAAERRLPARRNDITVLADFYSMVPHTLDTQALAISGRSQIRFQRSGETIGYHLVDPLLYGDRITLHREAVRRDAVVPGEIYLDVPDRIRDDLQEIATALRGATDTESIVNTLRFFREGFEYTLEPPQPADRSRFLSAFLEEHRRGYCVHFATAFTMLSRMHGIPTRYVTGFLVQPPPDEFATGVPMFEDVTVSGYSAHAWPEVWLPGIGWRVVEATPPMQPIGYENTFFDRYTAIRDEGRTVLQLQEILRQDLREQPDETRFELRIPHLPTWLAAVPLAALLVAGGMWLHRSRDVDRQFRTTVRRLRNRSVRVGFAAPERVGWTGWADAPVGHARRGALLVLGVCFGSRSPTRRDLRFLHHWNRWHLTKRNRPDRR